MHEQCCARSSSPATQAQLDSLQRQVGIMDRQLAKAAEQVAAEAKEAKRWA